MTAPLNPSLQDLLQAKKAQILAIADRHGAYNIRVFGSVARAEATDTSDIDLLVDYDPARRSPWFPVGLVQELEALLEHKVDVATPAMLKERIRDRVMQEAIPL
ncbi:nucleotidyltransferase family protein [Phormidium sp. FACHB-322]|uniref:nucleotidyltransferase family protein n=1 Tax=Cyanophyceae TaxID=3028117 RepID=UPI001687E68B|nr:MULTISPECIES: nucleotidyltransferase family protein [Cyanophyceae]MBD2028379.1 nucleotidyltransferase family protein [Phormidium sp. FACHB-322]MBD2053174.1 nucleotidyltransferase family protein [Leptolyngbya sp. FACHB-60]